MGHNYIQQKIKLKRKERKSKHEDYTKRLIQNKETKKLLNNYIINSYIQKSNKNFIQALWASGNQRITFKFTLEFSFLRCFKTIVSKFLKSDTLNYTKTQLRRRNNF